MIVTTCIYENNNSKSKFGVNLSFLFRLHSIITWEIAIKRKMTMLKIYVLNQKLCVWAE